MRKLGSYLKILVLCLGIAAGSAGCSSDETPSDVNGEKLYAVITDSGAQRIDIIPQDYVLTLSNIVSYDQTTGTLKLRNVEEIAQKSYPYPKAYTLSFYSEGKHLFTTHLNNLLSSLMVGPGLVLYLCWTDESGISRFMFDRVRIADQDGKIDGDPTDEEEKGFKRFEQILKAAGKISNN